MKNYIIQITDKALGDMEEIYYYIANNLQSPASALGQYNRIAKAINGLKNFPERIKLMESEQEKGMGMRQLIVDNYSAFYIIEGEKVVVVRVLYSASDISERLKDK